MKDTAHYTPLLSDSDEADAGLKGFPSQGGGLGVLQQRSTRRSNIFYLALVSVQAFLILGLIAFNWSTYSKLNSAACSQVIYCELNLFPRLKRHGLTEFPESSFATPLGV